VEILIHIGIDTVTLDGKYFTSFVKKGLQVERGDLLIEFNLEKIKEAGYDSTTMIIITNSNDYLDVIPTNSKNVKIADDLIAIV